jgi:hypothetical protein
LGFEGLLRNKRRSSGLATIEAGIARGGKALMVVKSMVLGSRSAVPVQRSALAELARIENQLQDVSRRLAVLEERSWQHLRYRDELVMGTGTALSVFADGENSFAAHVAFGMSKFRLTN